MDFYTLITFILLTLTIMTQLLEQNAEAAAVQISQKKHLSWSLFLRSCKLSGL